MDEAAGNFFRLLKRYHYATENEDADTFCRDNIFDSKVSYYNDGKEMDMNEEFFNLSRGTRSSKRKPAPNPPSSRSSEGNSRHVLASELTQCDLKGWLMDEVRGLNVWVVVADMLFCVFDSDEAEISRDVVMLPGCRIRPVVFKSAPSSSSLENEFGSSKTITGIDKFQFLIDDVSTKRKLLFGVNSRNDLDMWIDVLLEAVSMDLAFDNSKRRESNPCFENEDGSLGLDLKSSYTPSSHVSRRPEILHLGNSLLKNGQTTSLTDFRQRLKLEAYSDSQQKTPLKASQSGGNTVTKDNKIKGLFVNLKSFGSLDSLLKKQKRFRSADDLEITERRSLDEIKNNRLPSPSASENSRNRHFVGYSRFRVLETSGISGGIGPVVRRQVSDIKDRFFNGSSYCGAPGVRLGELTGKHISGPLQYRVMMKWIKVWCVVDRDCFYGFKSKNDAETPIVAVVLKHCMVSFESDSAKQIREQFVFKLSQPHCKGIYLSSESKAELCEWLQQLRKSCHVQADDELSIEKSSECTQSYDSAFSNGSVASSQNEYNDKFNINTSSSNSPQHDEVFHVDSHNGESSTEEWDTYSNDSQHDTISELNDPFSRPPPSIPLSDRKDKSHFLHLLKSKLKITRKKSLPEPILEREMIFPDGRGVLILDDEVGSRSYKSSSVDIRRSKSFSVQTLSRMSSDSESESNSSHSGIKIHKPLCVKTVPAIEITDPTLCGYLERRNHNGQWTRYWFLLKENSLYCYLSTDDRITVDVIILHDYHVSSLVDRFRGKRYVILLSHEEFLPLHLSTETREELTTWLDGLQAVSEPLSEGKNNTNLVNEQVELYRQRLLAEVLRQKQILEIQRADRQKKLSASANDLQPLSTLHDGDEQICQMTRLKQRRMSTQIKMDTLQKQLLTTNGSKKSLFSFGKKKLSEEHNPYVIEQLKELSSTMEQLNRDLDQNGNCNTRSKLALNSYSSKNIDVIEDFVDQSAVQRSNSLKSSMQKLAHKTFIKASWHKRRKSRNHQSNSSIDSDESHGSLHSDSDLVDLTKPRLRSLSSDRLGINCEWSLSSDSDLNHSSLCLSHQSSCEHSPLSPTGDNPMSFEIEKLNKLDTMDDSCPSPDNLGDLNSSPRREVDPMVLAEIEAFEEMTRQMMGRMTVTS